MNPTQTLAEALRSHVYELAGKIGERSVRRPESLAAAREYVRGRLILAGYDVDAQPYQVEGRTYENLLAVLPGAQEGRLVIGAHYDTAEGTRGADDNASGVAGLIELARLAKTASHRKTLVFAAFSTEEPPHFGSERMGSRFYARHARRRQDPIEGMICLEMIGCFSKEKGRQRYPPFLKYFFPDRADFISLVGNFRSRHLLAQVREGLSAHMRLPLEHATLPAIFPGVSWSDHRSFWKEGIPAVMLTDTAFYRNENYHRPTDTCDTLDFDSMAELVGGLAKTIEMLE